MIKKVFFYKLIVKEPTFKNDSVQNWDFTDEKPHIRTEFQIPLECLINYE